MSTQAAHQQHLKDLLSTSAAATEVGQDPSSADSDALLLPLNPIAVMDAQALVNEAALLEKKAAEDRSKAAQILENAEKDRRKNFRRLFTMAAAAASDLKIALDFNVNAENRADITPVLYFMVGMLVLCATRILQIPALQTCALVVSIGYVGGKIFNGLSAPKHKFLNFDRHLAFRYYASNLIQKIESLPDGIEKESTLDFYKGTQAAYSLYRVRHARFHFRKVSLIKNASEKLDLSEDEELALQKYYTTTDIRKKGAMAQPISDAVDRSLDNVKSVIRHKLKILHDADKIESTPEREGMNP